jgi:hypothetical protein
MQLSASAAKITADNRPSEATLRKYPLWHTQANRPHASNIWAGAKPV